MKLLQTMISGFGFRDAGHNPTRLAMLDVLLAVARLKSADLLMLPAGYLAAESLFERDQLIRDVAQRAETARTTVAFGVDLPEPTEAKGARSPRLPYSAAVRGLVNGGPWQQTSSTSANAA